MIRERFSQCTHFEFDGLINRGDLAIQKMADGMVQCESSRLKNRNQQGNFFLKLWLF